MLKSHMFQSLYIHIPFCIKRCLYCDFVSDVYDLKKADNYLYALNREISNIADTALLSTVFIGGGTPTVLPSKSITNFIRHIFEQFKFTDNYEATIEANPGTLDLDKLNAIRTSGMNRISLGVQSFNNKELSFLGRIHTNDEAHHAVGLSKKAGFMNIGIDLIYGIPGQSLADWKKTLEKTLRLEPHHISAYELTVEEGTGLYRLLNATSLNPVNRPALLSEDQIIDMYNHTIDYLASNGFIHYEISNFARPGYECKHNLNYWNRGEYYGAGLGAHSFINGDRFCNTDNLDEYMKAISSNRTHVKSTERISGNNAISEAIFLGLRKAEGINIESFSRRYKINILTAYHKEIKEFQDAGLIETSASDCSYETNLRLTRKGFLLSNEVFTKFIDNS